MRRPLVIAVCLAVVAVVGIALSRFGGDSSGDGVQRVAAAADETRSADSAGNSLPASIENPAGDARRAAVDAVALTDDVFRAGFISRRELIETFATESFGSELADETSQQVTGLLVELGERDVVAADVSLVEQPVASRIVEVGATTAEVDVWSVLVIAADGAGPARQVWRTVSVDLELVDGAWLVDGWASGLGPTPALAPEVDLSDVRDVARVIGWVHVTEARV